MALAGYSGTPVIKKLGIQPKTKLLLVGAPDNYLALIERDVSKQLVKTGDADLVHLFVRSKKELFTHFHQLIKKIPATAVIWISWYKKSSKIPTDITEDIIREIVLPTGWVDVKVCAVSELWSGLKIVKRVSER